MTEKTEKTQKYRRLPYQPPCAEIINIETECVLCSSGLMGNSTESVTTEIFAFP